MTNLNNVTEYPRLFTNGIVQIETDAFINIPSPIKPAYFNNNENQIYNKGESINGNIIVECKLCSINETNSSKYKNKRECLLQGLSQLEKFATCLKNKIMVKKKG